jgi:predicted Fe-S protein YdhL (DUF1289 family)
MDTPCVQVCVVDSVTGLCIGCGRSPTEIVVWPNLSPDQRRTIADALPSRLRTMTTRSARGRGRRSRC